MNNKEYLEKYLPPEQLKEGLEKLAKGISPQYIVGNVNFYGNLINVDPRVLIPRFETELLVEKTINYINKLNKNFNLKVLDLCTGSGCIAITLKKELPKLTITATDISKPALELASYNAKTNKTNITFIESDLFTNIKNKYNIIIANPPYIKETEKIDPIVKNNEPSIALYAKNNGLYYYQEILKQISNHLEKEYLIAFEIGYQQALSIKKLANKYLPYAKITVEKDYSNKDRFIFIRSKEFI